MLTDYICYWTKVWQLPVCVDRETAGVWVSMPECEGSGCFPLHTQLSLLGARVLGAASHSPSKWVIFYQFCLSSDTAIPLKSASSPSSPCPNSSQLEKEIVTFSLLFLQDRDGDRDGGGMSRHRGKKKKAGMYADLLTHTPPRGKQLCCPRSSGGEDSPLNTDGSAPGTQGPGKQFCSMYTSVC